MSCRGPEANAEYKLVQGKKENRERRKTGARQKEESEISNLMHHGLLEFF